MAIFLPVDLEGNLNIRAENTESITAFPQRYNFELGLYSNNEKRMQLSMLCIMCRYNPLIFLFLLLITYKIILYNNNRLLIKLSR